MDKRIIINGNNFSDLEGFYGEIDNIITVDLNWNTGHNLDAFNDLLRGGFGVHEYKEPIELVWQNSEKSKKDLSSLRNGKTIYQTLVDIIGEHSHIEFSET